MSAATACPPKPIGEGWIPFSAPAPSGRTLSPSQVGQWLDCQAAWWFKRLGLPDPPNANLALGRAIHEAAAVALNAQRQGVSVEWQELADSLRAFLDIELSAAVLRDDDDAEQLHSQAADMLRAWWEQSAPHTHAAAVESDLSGTLGGVPVRGIADVLTKDGVVIDLKTASKKPAGISGNHVLQLTTYAALADCRKARIVTITKTKTPAVHEHTLSITPEHIRHAERLYSLAAEQMEAGLYLPNRNSNFCSRANCAFAEACLAEFGGEVRE
jgi:CRISPR/Cas system-associated exonuclease Cas4 (RecB family)